MSWSTFFISGLLLGLCGGLAACQRPLLAQVREFPYFQEESLTQAPKLIGRQFKSGQFDTISLRRHKRAFLLYYPRPSRGARSTDTLARDAEGHSYHQCYQVEFVIDTIGRPWTVSADLSPHHFFHYNHPVLLKRHLRRLARGYLNHHRFLPAQQADANQRLHPVATRGTIEIRFDSWKPLHRRLRPVARPTRRLGLWFYAWKPRERFRRASQCDTLVYEDYPIYVH